MSKFFRLDGRSGGGYLCDKMPWVDHIAPGCSCPVGGHPQ